MSNPHDNLFREVFSDPREMACLLRSSLPAELADEIDWPTLTRLPGSFVDAALREHHTDLLFSVLVGGELALLYVLPEHKSRSDHDTVCQMHRYVSRIWEHWQKEHPGKPLPPILPYVFHHGDRPWTGATRLHQRIGFAGMSPAMGAYLRGLTPDLGFVLDDLAAQSEADLANRALRIMGHLATLLMTHSRRCTDEQFAAALYRWRDLLSRLVDLHGQDRLGVLFSYCLDTTELQPRLVAAALGDSIDHRIKEALMTTGERLRSEGRMAGRVEGRAEGRAEMLLVQLTRRFGPPGNDVEARVRQAQDEDLFRWAEAVLTAASLEEVFAA